MENSVATNLLLHIVQYWREYSVNEEKKDLTLVLYCSHIMYKYYSSIGIFPIKHNEEGEKIHN